MREVLFYLTIYSDRSGVKDVILGDIHDCYADSGGDWCDSRLILNVHLNGEAHLWNLGLQSNGTRLRVNSTTKGQQGHFRKPSYIVSYIIVNMKYQILRFLNTLNYLWLIVFFYKKSCLTKISMHESNIFVYYDKFKMSAARQRSTLVCIFFSIMIKARIIQVLTTTQQTIKLNATHLGHSNC